MEGYQTMADPVQPKPSTPLNQPPANGGGALVQGGGNAEWSPGDEQFPGADELAPAVGAYERQKFLGILTILATFQWINAAVNCAGFCVDIQAYDLALGVVSCVISGGWWLQERNKIGGDLPSWAVQLMAAFLSIWWACGMVIVTNTVAATTGNQYFTIWGSFIVSSWVLFAEVAESRQLFQRGKDIYEQNQHLCICALAGLVVTIASASILLRTTLINSPIYQYAAYGVAAGVVSFVLCVVLLFMVEKMDNNVKRVVLGLNFVWWLAATGVLTVRTPFQTTGNGYFGCWIALYAASMLVLQSRG